MVRGHHGGDRKGAYSMAAKKYRSLKVYEQSGYHYKPTPSIHLQGQWLKDIGFESGKFIQVCCENGKLVITLDEAREEVEAEQERLFASLVAERKARYRA